MSEIAITQAHALPEDELKELLLSVVDKLEQRYDLKPSWLAENHVKLHRAGIKGELRFDADKVELQIHLGMMMRPLRGTIEKAVRDALQEKLG